MKEYITIFVSAMIVNNFVLAYFIGICPFVGISKRISSAWGMGMATTFVLIMTALVTWPIFYLVLAPLKLEVLEYAVFILVIASLVQFVEMFIYRFLPELYRALGIYLPLITTNCAILGFALFMVLRKYDFGKTLIFGLGAGLGFTLALIIMAGIREALEEREIPPAFRGAPITLITAGLLALAFMGFAGLLG